jgi:hypothetical protein
MNTKFSINESLWVMFITQLSLMEAIEQSNQLLAWTESLATPTSLYRSGMSFQG